MLNFDWDETMSEGELRSELVNSKGEPFNFRGPGWYRGNDIALILENQYSPGFYDIYVWNTPEEDPRDRLNEILALPIHTIPVSTDAVTEKV